MTTTDWVPVMAPPQLATRFLREVAEYVAQGYSDEPRLWGDATDADIAKFIGELTAGQHRLLVSLAFGERPASAATHAERLGAGVDDIAGFVGPINKRAKKQGWMSPIQSHRAFTGATTEKVVTLDDRVALWVKTNYEEDNDK